MLLQVIIIKLNIANATAARNALFTAQVESAPYALPP